MEVRCPDAIKQYNASMSRVDLVDMMASIYRISARTCKWPVRVILHFLDCALTNAWILYRDSARRTGTPSKDILDFMAFRLRVGECWARRIVEIEEREEESDITPGPSTKRRKVVQHPLPEVRKEKAVHLPQFVQSAQSNHCRFRGCKSRTRIKCVSCDVFLCVAGDRNCFMQYHKD